MMFEFIGVIIIIIILVIAIVRTKKKLDSSIKRIDLFDRPSINRDINNTILGLCLLSGLLGCAFTLIMLNYLLT